MQDGWRHKLKKIISERGLGLKPLSLAAGLSETFLRDVFQRETDPGIDSLRAVCDVLHIPLSYLFDDAPLMELTVPIVGEASGGERWTPFDDSGTGDDLTFTLTDTDPIAIRVRGHSMAPVYRDHDDLICSRMRGADMQRALHKDCVVRTVEGESYVKHLLKGTKARAYRLRSYNAAYPDLEDQVLEWAAPIVWVRRN
jgi:transcriptional regulator with XRE-family HTH domain